MKKGRKAVLFSCFATMGIAAALVAVSWPRVAEWIAPPPDPRRELVTLDFKWDPQGAVRCETSPYLRPDGGWLEAHEFRTDPRATTPRFPDLREIESYLEFRKRDRTPILGEPHRLAVLVNYHREVPWKIVADLVDICTRLGIAEVDLDSDD